jgi:hypothetical protein
MNIYDRRQDNRFINFINVPSDGDIIIDMDGKKWTYRNSTPFSAGIHLEDENKNNHPKAYGMQSWWEFASWFNQKEGEG